LLDRITVDGHDHAVIGVGVLRDPPLPEGKVVAVLDVELLFVGQGVPTRQVKPVFWAFRGTA
jgi:hypothetical protein